MKTKEMKVCSICHGEYEGFGHNAYPVNEGRCCDECNTMVVIPVRLWPHLMTNWAMALAKKGKGK